MRSFAVLVVILLITMQSVSCREEKTQHGKEQQSIGDVALKFAQKLVADHAQLQGGAIAIVYKGQVIYQKTFGFQKNKSGAITDSVLFPLASVSKAVTATVIAQLIKQRKLSLDHEMSSYMPQVAKGIKVRDVLSHSSGYLVKDSNLRIEQGKKRRDLFVNHLTQLPAHHPGEVYCYHNLMFSSVEDVVSQVTGKPWPEQVTHFWHSLGVKKFATCSVPDTVSVASPHDRKKVKQSQKTDYVCLRRLPNHYPQSVCSAAGIYGCLTGLIAFLELHLGYRPDVLTKADLAPFYQPHVETPEIFSKWGISWPFPVEKMQAFYGLGWRIIQLKNDRSGENRLIFHGGYLKGVNTFVGFMPNHDLGIVILTNQDSSWALRAGIGLWGQVIKTL